MTMETTLRPRVAPIPRREEKAAASRAFAVGRSHEQHREDGEVGYATNTDDGRAWVEPERGQPHKQEDG